MDMEVVALNIAQVVCKLRNSHLYGQMHREALVRCSSGSMKAKDIQCWIIIIFSNFTFFGILCCMWDSSCIGKY